MYSRSTGGGLIGLAVVLIVIGAILRFAVTVTTSGFNIHKVGDILLLVGIILAILSVALLVMGSRRRVTTRTDVRGRLSANSAFKSGRSGAATPTDPRPRYRGSHGGRSRRTRRQCRSPRRRSIDPCTGLSPVQHQLMKAVAAKSPRRPGRQSLPLK